MGARKPYREHRASYVSCSGSPACRKLRPTGIRWRVRSLQRGAVCSGVKSRPPRVRVLLVEDDAVLARVYSCALAAAGYLVDTAPDGAEGFARLLATPYDVIVTDLRMPKLSGLDLLEEVRRRRPEVPVVMVTAELDSATFETARSMGPVRFLLKPMTMHQLARAVEGALALVAGRARSSSSRRAAG